MTIGDRRLGTDDWGPTIGGQTLNFRTLNFWLFGARSIKRGQTLDFLDFDLDFRPSTSGISRFPALPLLAGALVAIVPHGQCPILAITTTTAQKENP